MTMTRTTQSAATGSARGRLPLRVEPPPGRRARLPELAVGVALMVGFALAAVLWNLSATDKAPALALAREVKRGQVIEAADLAVIYLASDGPVAHVSPDDSGSLIGRVALSDLPVGALLNGGNVAPRVALAPGEGVVGLDLAPGQVPATELVPGDVVNVVAGPVEAAGATPGLASIPVLATRATVYSVGQMGTQGRRFVSIKLGETNANLVAAAAERVPLRLVLVAK